VKRAIILGKAAARELEERLSDLRHKRQVPKSDLLASWRVC
jgi:hypothetical protein